MTARGDTRHSRTGAIASATALITVVAMASGLGPIVAIPVLLVGLAIGWRLVPGFGRTLLAGWAGGVVAGLVVLGPGLRLAMRVVAIVDPVRVPEFTWEGTLSIIIFVGGITGLFFGTVAAFLIRITPLLVSVAVVVLGFMGLLLVPGDLRAEFVELGAGPWLNVPMFTGVVTLFALVLVDLVRRFSHPKVDSSVVVELQA